jgi:hypothetical protein
MEPGLLQLQRDDRYPKRLGGHNKIVRQSEFQRLTTGAKIEIRTTMVDRIKIVLTKLGGEKSFVSRAETADVE